MSTSRGSSFKLALDNWIFKSDSHKITLDVDNITFFMAPGRDEMLNGWMDDWWVDGNVD